MKREEQLDHLIETRQQGEKEPAQASDEIMVRLAAAEALIGQQGNAVPDAAMAKRIEKRVRTHIQQQMLSIRPTLARSATRSRNRYRLLRPLLCAAVLLFLLCAGTLTVAAHTLPGDPLYGVKRAENQFSLLFANNPSNRAIALLGQLRSSLNDLDTVGTDGRSTAAIQQALDTVITQTKEAQTSVGALPAGANQEQVRQDLANVIAIENQTLRGLLDRGDWSLRLAFTQQLGAIGQGVPTIKQITISQQNNGYLLVTVTGTNFNPQARLVIDGQTQGTVTGQTVTQLVAMMSQQNWQDDTQMIGVLNPDGTAAQIRVVFHLNDDRQPTGGGDNHGGSGSSGGSSTPTSGNGHGSSGGSSTPTSGSDHGSSGGSSTPTSGNGHGSSGGSGTPTSGNGHSGSGKGGSRGKGGSDG